MSTKNSTQQRKEPQGIQKPYLTLSVAFSNDAERNLLLDVQSQFSAAVRSVYSTLSDNTCEPLSKEYYDTKVDKLIQFKLAKYDLLNSALVQYATKEGIAVYRSWKRTKNVKKVRFGKVEDRAHGRISRDEFLESRNRGISVHGLASEDGNHFIKILNETSFQYRLKNQTWIDFTVAQVLKKQVKKKIQTLLKVAQDGSAPISYRLKLSSKGDKLEVFYQPTQENKTILHPDDKRLLSVGFEKDFLISVMLELDTPCDPKALARTYKKHVTLEKHLEYHRRLVESVYDGIPGKSQFEETVAKVKHCRIEKRDVYAVEHVENLCDVFIESVRVADLRGLNPTEKKAAINKFYSDVAKDVEYWHVGKIVAEDATYNRTKGVKSLVKRLQVLAKSYNLEYTKVNGAYSDMVGTLFYANKELPDEVAKTVEIGRRGFRPNDKYWFYPSKVQGKLREIIGDIGTKTRPVEKLSRNSIECFKQLYSDYYSEIKRKYGFSLAAASPSNLVSFHADICIANLRA